MKNQLRHFLKFISASLCVGVCLVANNAKAQYFDVNGATANYGVVNGGSYSWDDANWGISGGAGATANWTAGGFARFYGGASGDSYAVTVNNSESIAGMWQHGVGVTVTINAAGSGALDLVTGDQGFLGASGGHLIINAPITGAGAVAPQTGTSTLSLFGNNTYSGGTAFGYSGAPLTYFNNNNSFGTGDIRLSTQATALFQALLATGGSTITLANNIANFRAGSGVNFAGDANTPVIIAGNVNMGANSLNIRSSGGSTSPLTLSGAINGTADVTFSANGSGNVISLNGANTYTGNTIITGVGGTGAGSGAIRVKLGSANAISTSSGVTLAGGILDPGAFNQAITAAPLTLAASSTIDFGAGTSEIDFANSSLIAWIGALDLANWDSSIDKLRFGTDNTGLTTDQLNAITFNGASPGTAALDPNGYVTVVPVPEPSTIALGLMSGLAFLGVSARRRFKK